MSDRQVRIIIAADVASAIRGLSQVEQGLGRVGQQGQRAGSSAESFGDKIKKGLEVAGVTLGLAGVAAAIGKTISVGMSFQDNMNSLRAVTNATAEQMGAVSNRARELGNDLDLPATSASDAAAAMLELSKGGLSVDQSMAAAKGTLLLAAAAQIDGAEAAEIQSAALNAFGLSADNADRVANVLANTANASAGSISDFAAGMQQSATVAHQFGISIEDTATVLGLFANAGIKGSDAGTSFKTALLALASPTKQQQAALDELNMTVYDAQGNFVGMRSVTEQLAAASASMSQEQFNAATSTAFGADAMRGASVLANAATTGYDNMRDSVSRIGGVQAVAAAQTEGLSGQLGKLQSAAEDVALSLFDNFVPALEGGTSFATTMVGALGGVVEWFAELPGPVQAATLSLAGVAALSGPLNALWVSLVARLAAAKAAMITFAATMRASVGSMAAAGAAAAGLGRGLLAAFGGPIGIAIAAGATALAFFAGSSDDAAASTEGFTGAVDENTGALTANAQAVVSKAAADSGSSAKFKELGGNVADYTAALAGNTEKQKLVRDTLTAAASAAAEAGVAYQAAGVGADGMAIASDNVSTVMGEQSGAFNDANGLLAEFDGQVAAVTAAQATGALVAEGAGTAIEGQGNAVEGAGAKAEAAATPMEAFKAATEQLGSAAATADAAVQFLTLTLDAASGHTITNEQATNAFNASLRGITSAASDYAAANDGIVEAQLRVNDATAKVIDVTNHLGLSQEEGGTTADDLTQANLDLAAANRDQELATGKVTDATDAQLDANVKAQQAALVVATALLTQTATTGTLAQATDVATASLQSAKDAFIAAQPQADILSGKAQLTADALFGIPKDTVAKIAEQGAAATTTAADGVTTAVNGIPGSKTANVNVNVTGLGDLAAARQAIADIPSSSIKSVQIEQNTLVYTTIAGTKMEEDGGHLFAANGLAFGRGMSQKRKGMGGGVTWAEQATGEEFYLSMKPGMESRNRGLASEAVSKLGGQTMWGGAGSFNSSSSGASGPINVTVTLRGDGPITEAALATATAVMDGGFRDVALTIERKAMQS